MLVVGEAPEGEAQVAEAARQPFRFGYDRVVGVLGGGLAASVAA